VRAHVVRTPQPAERLAARRKLAHEVLQAAVVGVAPRLGPHDRDAHLGEQLPVGVEVDQRDGHEDPDATDIVIERGDEGVAKIKVLTDGLGAHSVIEAVGTQEAMMQAIRSTRPGGHVGYVGVSHDVALDDQELFFSGVHLHGGPAPVRRFLPELIDLIWRREIDPGRVFDLTLPLEEAAEGYKAMDERRAIKVLLTP
jgi:threonine dehydrogenase-like Zn-dependent dehydrogenase